MKLKQSAVIVRQRHYAYDESALEHYDSGNAVLTHEWNALSLIIPVGERYYIRSVKALASQAKDPDLQQQIKGFIGQETIHSHETNRFLDILEKQGIPVQKFQDWQEAETRWFENFLPWLSRFQFIQKLHLASTAGGEHYTSVFAFWHLNNRYSEIFPPSIRDLTQWHGAEELEHKAVAFDLLQVVAPRNYFLRIAGFIVAMAVTWRSYRKALSMLLELEGLTRAQLRKERKQARKIRIPLLSLRFPGLLAYLKPGFHPNDLDDDGLGQQILAEQAARGGA